MSRHPARITAVAVAVAASAWLAACGGGTDPATQVTPTSAVLRAHGHTDASAGHYEFQYAAAASALGTMAGYTTPVRGPIPAHVPATGDIAFGEQVKALRPSTTYSYRVCGGDAQVHPDACAATRSFTTPAGSPVVDFAAQSAFGAVSEIHGVAVADLNRDGNPDLAYSGFQSSRTSVSVELGDGAGGFGAPMTVPLPAAFLPAGTTTGGIEARDVNHDGKVDLAVGGPAGVAIVLGDGAGGFGTATTVAVDGAVSQLVARDVDRDGNLDLVALAGSHVVVLLGSAPGAFTAGPDVDAAEAPARFALGDLDHDGRVDLVTATTAGPGVSVLRGTGTGGFAAPAHVAAPGARPTDVVVGDLDRDGNPDAIVGGSVDQPGPASLVRGDGKGGLGAPVLVPNAPAGGLVLADVDGDGRLDLAGEFQDPSVGFGRIRVSPGNGDGTFQTPNDFSPIVSDIGEFYVEHVDQIVAADLFHDGRPSLVTAGWYGRYGVSGGGVVMRTRVHAP
ncbi:MAG: hypothetical protein QOH43_4532 [Solirubrobacteraceae bacterium]|nr:hypothetical protein [Solirubrobacteraceae bacterium]